MTKFIPKLSGESDPPEEDLSKIVQPLPDQEETSANPTSKPSSQRRRKGMIGLWFWIGLAVSLGGGIIGGGIALNIGLHNLRKSIPESVDGVLTYAREGTARITSADGTVIQEIGDLSHETLKYWQIPDSVVNAFIASEDSRFQDHRGVDVQGILRAAVVNFQAGEVVEGGSTITQQLTRIAFLNPEKTLWRKLREVRIAQKIEQRFTKEQILERYLNLVYLGSGAYGVADAAWIYFGKPAQDLTIGEAAMIAGITPAPSAYSPFVNPEAAKERRDLVLERMETKGFITTTEAQAAIASPIEVDYNLPKRLERKVPYFTDHVQQELVKYVSPEAIKAGGLTVETSINLEWQALAEAEISKAIEKYGRWQRFEQAAMVVIDPRNGQIRAMVGGKDYEDDDKNGQYNRVTQAQRQPGSTFKPFVYATAIATGMSPYQSFLDAEYTIGGYKPNNYSKTYQGWISIRDALISSVNVVAVRTLVEVGWDPIINIANRMGIESELKPVYSLALGSNEVNLLELTSAYGTFANEGIHHQPHGITRVLDREGKVIFDATTDLKTTKAIDPNSVAITTWMLRGVVTSGTGRPAQIGRPAAGKTGTTDKARDLWFVGYVPQLATGVWLGNDKNKNTWGASSTAAIVWGRFMKQIVDELPVEKFPPLPRLQGRKGSIKAKPLKGKRGRYTKKPSRQSSSSSSNRSRSRTGQPSRRRSSTRSTRRSAPAPAPRRNRAPAPAPRRNRAPAPAPAPRRRAPAPAPPPPPPAPAPAPPPSVNKPSKPSAPIAPPVQKKPE